MFQETTLLLGTEEPTQHPKASAPSRPGRCARVLAVLVTGLVASILALRSCKSLSLNKVSAELSKAILNKKFSQSVGTIGQQTNYEIKSLHQVLIQHVNDPSFTGADAVASLLQAPEGAVMVQWTMTAKNYRCVAFPKPLGEKDLTMGEDHVMNGKHRSSTWTYKSSAIAIYKAHPPEGQSNQELTEDDLGGWPSHEVHRTSVAQWVLVSLPETLGKQNSVLRITLRLSGSRLTRKTKCNWSFGGDGEVFRQEFSPSAEAPGGCVSYDKQVGERTLSYGTYTFEGTYANISLGTKIFVQGLDSRAIRGYAKGEVWKSDSCFTTKLCDIPVKMHDGDRGCDPMVPQSDSNTIQQMLPRKIPCTGARFGQGPPGGPVACDLTIYVDLKPLLNRGYTVFRLWTQSPSRIHPAPLKFRGAKFLSPDVRKQDAARVKPYFTVCTKEGKDRWEGGRGKDLGGCCIGLQECTVPREATDPLYKKFPTITLCQWEC